MKKTYLVFMTLALALFMSSLGWADISWQIVYETHFVTDQGWQTRNEAAAPGYSHPDRYVPADNYYLDTGGNLGGDSRGGYYSSRQIDGSNDEAYHLLPQAYGAGTPLRMEFDVRMDSFQYPGQLNISLNGPGQTTIGDPEKIDSSITLSLSGSAKLQWADGKGPYTEATRGIYWEVWESFGGTPVLGREYHAILEWLPDEGRLSAWLTGDSTNWSTIDFVPELGNAFNGINRIAMSIVGDDYDPGYDAHGAGYFDNIVVSQIPEPATLFLLGLGGLVLRRRRR
jgi:hypothetical protein